MFSPKSLPIWRFSAGRIFAGQIGIAAIQGDGQSGAAGHCLPWQGPSKNTCYPSLPLRSGRSQTGSRLSNRASISRPKIRQCRADGAGGGKFPYDFAAFALKSASIRNAIRGSKPCANLLSSSLFSRFRFRPACRTQPRAASPVRRLARLLPMRWMKTWSLARRLAVWPAQHLAALTSACPLATDLTPASGQGVTPHHGVVRASRPGGPISFALRLAAPAC